VVSYYANENVDTVKENIEEFNVMFADKNLVFKNQSQVSISNEVFNHLYPYHKKSVFSPQLKRYFQTNAGLVEDYLKSDKIKNSFAIDINKCRTSCLRDNILGKYKRFSILDRIEPYVGGNVKDMKEGFYYIKTNNTFPCRGNGWYSNGFIKFLCREKIKYKVKYQLLASNTYDDDYLKKFFDNITQFTDFKFMSNSFIGTMAQTEKNSSTVWFEKNFDTCCFHYFKENNMKKKINISPIEDEEQNVLFYQLESKVFSQKNENDIPIYNQILENEYIKLYELNKKVRMLCDDPSLRLVSCRTDELTYNCWLADESKITSLYSDKIGGYKKGAVRFVKDTPFNFHSLEEALKIDFERWSVYEETDFDSFQDIVCALLDKNITGV
jgi:hypothetical protein